MNYWAIIMAVWKLYGIKVPFIYGLSYILLYKFEIFTKTHLIYDIFMYFLENYAILIA